MKCVALLALMVGVLSCGGGGGGPSGVDDVLNVTGLWIEVDRLLQNTCGVSIPQENTVDVVFTQQGSQLTGAYDGEFVAHGTIDPTRGNFSLSLTIESSDIVAILLQSGRFSSNDRYTAESRTTITDGFTSCVIRTSDSGRRL